MKMYSVRTALILGLSVFAAETHAQIFKLKFNPIGGLNPAIQQAIETELTKVEKDINADLPAADSPGRLMKGMANSSIMAGKGIGSDYASDMEVFLIGAGVGVGADLEKNKAADTDLSGAGLQAGVVLGTNLKWMDTKEILGLDTNKLNVYVNFVDYNHEMKTGDTNAKLDLTTVGFHVSYDWIKGNGNKFFGWGGVKLHTGYEYNSTKLRFDSKISEPVTASASGATLSSSVLANPYAIVDIASHSVPVEISSSVRFLYLFSLFGGLGMDFNSGTAKGRGDLNSQTADVSCTGGGCPGASVGTIETSADIDGKGKASPFFFRGFAGLQINLPYVRIYGQVDKAFGSELVGASAGVRFVY